MHKYGSFQELEKHIAKIKAPWVTLHHTDNDLILELVNEVGNVGTKVVVDESLGFLAQSSCKKLLMIMKYTRNTDGQCQRNILISS